MENISQITINYNKYDQYTTSFSNSVLLVLDMKASLLDACIVAFAAHELREFYPPKWDQEMKSVLYSLLSSSDGNLSAGHQTRGEWS